MPDHIKELWGLYVTCKDLNCLPEDGGLFAQDALTVEAFGIFSMELHRIAEWRLKENVTTPDTNK